MCPRILSAVMKSVRRMLSYTSLCLLLGCSAPIDPNQAMVSVFAVNGWTDTVTFEFYDLVCSRGLRDVRLRASEGAQIESCADENGRARIRYRRERIAAMGQPWTIAEDLRAGQQVLMH